ncbi:sodium-independent sulfate anion transporter isoform X2 [Ornithorhynchus anatinus]|uniref:sodium-independent sulfate anion transporter isoform X2 n=1 Tax=Ornithorhynchus anatinus TaxID=9258 RepID=UPI0010A90E33|nr:sodium-independent sulfate anion transporter isoform X2 [Ornithorhynchus anatinus]
MARPARCCPSGVVQRTLPILSWLPHYNLRRLQLDFIAGLTVGLTVVPQALAYAEVAGLPVQPAYAVLLSFLSGAIQLAMGIFHLGFLLDFISSPVIKGFTSAASVTIGFGQVKNLLGLRDIPQQFLLQVYHTFRRVGEARVGDAVLGLVCLGALLALKEMRGRMPALHPGVPCCVRGSRLLVWAASTARNALVVSFAGLTAYSFQATGSQPFTLTGRTAEGLPPFRPPPFSVVSGNETVPFSGMVQDMGSGLAVVPLMGLLESIAIAKAFASQNGYRIDANQELLAIGLTNLLGSFVSSYPVTGSFGRTAVNAQTGVCTPAGGLVTGAVVLLSLAYLTPLFYYIPKAALAAVIITAVAPLFDVGIFRTLWRVKRLDLVPLCATFLLCFWEVQYGIIAGVLVSGLLLLHAVARPRIQVTEGEVVVLRPASGLHFPAAEALREAVYSRALKVTPPRCAILDCTHVSSIDSTVVAGLEELLEEFRHRGVSLVFSGLQAPILWILLTAELRGFQHFSTVEEAEKHLREEPGTESYHANESPSPKSRIDQ